MKTSKAVMSMRESVGRRAHWVLAMAFFGAVAPTALAGQSHESLLASLQADLDSIVGGSAIPGMTLGIALPDGQALGMASGRADTLAGRRMTPPDRMLQGSVGKTYFGAVALQLVEEGLLDLDARVERYLGHEPWFSRIPNSADVTVRQLMNHTSGIVRYELNPDFLEDLTAEPERVWTPEDRLEYLFDAEAPFAAGEGWDYSDTNYILVAMIIEEVTGSTAYAEIQARLLEPLGLQNTVPSDRPEVPGLVQGYAGPDNPFGGFEEMLVDGRLVISPQFEWGGGGFASTAEDLAIWARHVHEGRAFAPGLMEQFRDGPSAPLGPQARYGLGVIMMELPVGEAWGHSGFMPGYRTEMYYFPDHRFSVAVQINSSDGSALPSHPLQMVNHLAGTVMEWLESGGDDIEVELADAPRGEGWSLSNRSAQVWTGQGRTGVRLDARAGHGVAWLDDSDFLDGSIEVSVRGSNNPGRSFVGIAFRGVDHDTFDAVYLRPFNFQAESPVRRARSLQYVSHPESTWPRLREEHPGQYEAAIDPPPDPEGFVHLRVDLAGGVLSVYVDGASEPNLRVEELSGRAGGRVGLWVGNNSDGIFSELVLRPRSQPDSH